MHFQGVEIRLAFLKLLYVLSVRGDYSERTIEERDAPVRARERGHSGKGKERTGVGRGEVIPVRNICREHLS